MLQVQPSYLGILMSNTGWGDLDPNTVRQAIREEGVQVIKDVLSDPQVMRTFWSAGIEAVEVHAQQKAGKWALGGLGAIFKRSILALAVAGLLYATGGWGALKAWLSIKA